MCGIYPGFDLNTAVDIGASIDGVPFLFVPLNTIGYVDAR